MTLTVNLSHSTLLQMSFGCVFSPSSPCISIVVCDSRKLEFCFVNFYSFVKGKRPAQDCGTFLRTVDIDSACLLRGITLRKIEN